MSFLVQTPVPQTESKTALQLQSHVDIISNFQTEKMVVFSMYIHYLKFYSSVLHRGIDRWQRVGDGDSFSSQSQLCNSYMTTFLDQFSAQFHQHSIIFGSSLSLDPSHALLKQRSSWHRGLGECLCKRSPHIFIVYKDKAIIASVIHE
jgi:hypothetical protein